MSTNKIKLEEQSDFLTAVFNYLVDNGYVTGPGSSTDNEIVLFQGTGGLIVKNSFTTIDDLLAGWIPAGQTFTYASADDPIYQVYVSGNVTTNALYKLGNKVKCTNNATTFYGFIVKVGAYDSGNNRTPVDLYGGTDYDLANSAITAPYISKVKSPDGFPLSPDKWTISFTDTADRAGSTSTGVWANPPSSSLAIHIGVWRTFLECAVEISATIAGTASQRGFRVTLSTANNSESDSGFTGSYTFPYPVITNGLARATVHREKIITLTTKTTHYINTFVGSSVNSITLVGTTLATTVKCVCAYL